MKLAMFQMKNEGSVRQNLEKSLRAIQEAAENHSDLIFFPEIQLTEFFPQFPKEKQNYDVKKNLATLDSQIIKSFCESAKKNHIYVSPNVYLEENGKSFDASILIDRNGRILGIQKMVHVAQASQFYEQDYYAPSDDGFKVFQTEIGNLGIVVCFDRHYPESIRTEALRGADLILIPTANTKAEPSEMFEWEIRVQAFQNSVQIAMCNRVGTENEMQFSGESIVCDADGNVVKIAGDAEQIVYAELDLQKSQETRKSKPYTNLRRTEFYE